MKILFDALRRPREPRELMDKPQEPDQNPCYCLVDDDKFIDHVAIITDRLLMPVGAGESINDVVIIVHVTATLFDSEHDIAPI
jgi:hypothetical protein